MLLGKLVWLERLLGKNTTADRQTFSDDEFTKAGHQQSWNYIWAIYLLKQLYLAEFRQVEANTKCDRDRLNCFISHVKLRLQESTC